MLTSLRVHSQSGERLKADRKKHGAVKAFVFVVTEDEEVFAGMFRPFLFFSRRPSVVLREELTVRLGLRYTVLLGVSAPFFIRVLEREHKERTSVNMETLEGRAGVNYSTHLAS